MVVSMWEAPTRGWEWIRVWEVHLWGKGPDRGRGQGAEIEPVKWDSERWGPRKLGHAMVRRGNTERCQLAVPVSVGGRMFRQAGEVAAWGRSGGAQTDVERETQAGKRALLREYLAACTAFYSEYAPTSSRLPDFEGICMFVAQRADFEALKAEEADLGPAHEPGVQRW